MYKHRILSELFNSNTFIIYFFEHPSHSISFLIRRIPPVSIILMLNRIDFQNAQISQQRSQIFNRTAPTTLSSTSSTPKVGFTGSVHKKLSHFLTTLSLFSTESAEFGKLLNQDKQGLKLKGTTLTQRVQELEAGLKVSLKQQEDWMVSVMNEEGKERLKKISESTGKSTEDYKRLAGRFKALRERIEALENTMGYYNAQETHL